MIVRLTEIPSLVMLISRPEFLTSCASRFHTIGVVIVDFPAPGGPDIAILKTSMGLVGRTTRLCFSSYNRCVRDAILSPSSCTCSKFSPLKDAHNIAITKHYRWRFVMSIYYSPCAFVKPSSPSKVERFSILMKSKPAPLTAESLSSTSPWSLAPLNRAHQ